MNKLQITDFTLSTALGCGVKNNREKLHSDESGLRPCDFFDMNNGEVKPLQTYIGQVDAIEDVIFENAFEQFKCRNNALSLLTLQQDGFYDRTKRMIEKYGASRVGLFMGTSTSGLHQTEKAYMDRLNDESRLPEWFDYANTHNMFSTTEFVRAYLGITGFSSVISTACSSSAKVFASAERAIEQGFCDAAVVGGTDSLCLTTLYGFNSLQLVSAEPCRPSDKNRNGISIGEASGFAVLEKSASAHQESQFLLSGYGESSDAYHMSSPHPEGEGARLAMEKALNTAGLNSEELSYVNLHGTATPANDQAESNAVSNLLGNDVACSSTKGWTGHTLGTAGIIEVIFSMIAMEDGLLLRSLNTIEKDSGIAINIQKETSQGNVNNILTNSFGFGGNNCSLLIEKR